MNADVAVIGLGSMGSMTIWQLARRGVSVIGFEQFGIGHDRGAAGGDTRIFRTAYAEGAEYVPILQQAYREWRQLEKESKQTLLTLTDGLLIYQKDSKELKNTLKSIEEYQLNHRILSKNEAEKEYPQHRLNPDDVIVVDQQAGFVRSQLAILAAVTRAEELGATIYRHSPVEKIETHSSEQTVKITANGQTYTVSQVIITAGPWINKVFPVFKEHIEIRRLVGTWFPAKQMAQFSPENFPVFTRNSKNLSCYGIPSIDGTMVKVAFGPNKPIESPNSLNKHVTTEEIDHTRELIDTYFSGLYNEPNRIQAFMEAYTKDGHPIIGKIPNQENVIVACGFSGHGFKMSSAIGKLLADLATDQDPGFNIEHLNPTRFLNTVNK